MTTANSAQRENWNGEGGQAWIADADRRDVALAGVADSLLRAADPHAGESVLDLGCGCGATSFAAARAVGATGSVSGVDISALMLGVARERAAASGLSNVAFTQADVQTHEFETARFDLAISRFGTMFFDDPQSAFANVARAVRPGGRLCIATWQPLAMNDWLTVPNAVLAEYGTVPDLGTGPGMFAQSDRSVLTRLLQSAGFSNVDIQGIDLPMTLGETPQDATDYVAASGMGRATMATIAPERKSAALDAVRQALAEHQGRDGVTLKGAVLITAASR